MSETTHMWRHASIVKAVVCTVVVIRSVNAPADVVSEGRGDMVAFVVEAVRSNGEKIRNGVFQCDGSRRIISPKDEFDESAESSVFCAFDYEHGRLRFDRTEPPLNPRQPGNGYGGQFVRTRDKVLVRSPSSPTMTILGRDTQPLRGVNPFDVRVLGCANLLEMEREVNLDMVFDAAEGFLQPEAVSDVEDADGVVKITWTFAEAMATRSIWFDKACGYCPIRLEDREQLVSGGGLAPPSNTVEVQWMVVNDRWVPETIRVEEKRGMSVTPDQPSQTREAYLRFVWESVNKGVDESLFDEWAIRKPDGTPIAGIVDARVTPPIVLKSAAPTSTSFPAPIRSTWPFVFWVLNAAAVIVVLVLIALRHARPHRNR